jgi:hypothetical protein
MEGELQFSRIGGRPFKTAPVRKVFTREQELADQIYFYFNKKLAFPRIMKMIKDKGYQGVFESLKEVRAGNFRNPLSMFVWKIGQQKVVFTEVK